jgi:hypothetical protein
MIKFHNVLLACALGAASLFSATAPASAAHLSAGAARPTSAARVLPGNRNYGAGYRSYGNRSYGYRNYGYRNYGYRNYGYRYGYGYPYGVSVGIGYGYVGGGYGYAPYPAVYGPRAYWARRPVWRGYRRAHFRRRVIR